MERDPKLQKWMKWLGIEACTCELAWKPLGRLDRIDMGKGWVRMTTEPQCPEHGTAAVDPKTGLRRKPHTIKPVPRKPRVKRT